MSVRSRALGACAALLLSVSAAPAALRAQAAPPDSQRVALALRILKVTKTSETMIAAITMSIPNQRAQMPNIPAEFWATFEARAKGSVDSLTTLMAPAWAEAFTREELQGLLAFYESPLGQRMVTMQPQIMGRTAEIGRMWGAKVGQDIMAEMLSRKKSGEP